MPVTPATTGTRPATTRTVVSTIVRRSSSVSSWNSDTITGMTTPWHPDSTVKWSTDSRLFVSSDSSSLKGVGGIP